MTVIIDGTNGITDVDGSAATPALTGTDTNTGIFFPAADTIAFAEGGAEVMRIDSSGNVGIGTTSPSYKLQVYGASNPEMRLGDAVVTYQLYTEGATAAVMGTVGSHALVYRTNATERMRIDSSGNVTFTNAFSKVFSISVSVAANAMTISASPLSLDFRSTTATSGTITTVTGTPANLTVPSNQSFGIATTTVSNRYAVLCFNNAGTLALGLSPLRGGVQLDETNFLSPTSTPTNTLTTIFSTITASNIAYRVIGFVDVIYVNGTGYSTAPTLVQGVGGQALTAMSSLGYSQTWQAVTRAAGTTYYNTTGRPIAWRYSITTAGSGQAVGTVTVNGISYADNWQVTSSYTVGTIVIVPPGGSYSFAIGGAAGGSAGQSYELR